MFARRNPLPLIRRLWHSIWPKTGWRRQVAYVAHRLRRLPGTPWGIAAGFACGAAVSFTPFIGFHFVLSMLLAAALRANLLASAIGTVIGNPWTFPFIWTWIYTLGYWILGGDANSHLPGRFSFDSIFENPLQVLLPMTVGCIPTATVAWFAFYVPLKSMISTYQEARRRRIQRRNSGPTVTAESSGSGLDGAREGDPGGLEDPAMRKHQARH